MAPEGCGGIRGTICPQPDFSKASVSIHPACILGQSARLSDEAAERALSPDQGSQGESMGMEPPAARITYFFRRRQSHRSFVSLQGTRRRSPLWLPGSYAKTQLHLAWLRFRPEHGTMSLFQFGP